MSSAPADSPAFGSLTVAEGVAWLVLDAPGRSVNTLAGPMVDWLEVQIAWLEEERARGGASAVRGVVLLSGKPEVFVAGADLEEIREISARPDARERVLEIVARGHALTRRLAGLGCPVVAAIHGACLGGGLELALACDLRVATEAPSTRLGLPEVQLGLIPGLGGTQRLPRLIGVPDALDLILTGKRLDARRARKMGLVDATCQLEDLRQAALDLLERGRPRREKKPLAARAADLAARLPLAKRLVYDQAREGVEEKTGGHYPAPRVAIEIVREGMELPLGRALDLEAGAFAELVTSSVSKSLVGIYFAKNAVEKQAAELAADALSVGAVGVLGAGLMGAGIAQVLAAKGFAVAMKDRDADSLARGTRAAAEVFAERLRRRRMTEAEMKTAMARIRPTTSYDGFRRVDLVIEAVFEDLEVKQTVLREVEARASEPLVFASNTSTIPIGRIAEASRRPERVVGMHFFSPVPKMPLLEVIRHPGTDREALATAVAVGRRMGKTVIVVEDGPGFFTSRVLAPFLNEAARILDQGARIDEIDRALSGWGFPVGPLALLDEVGLDIARHAAEGIRPELGARVVPPPVFQKMIDDGRLGRKSGRGFYDYSYPEKHPDLAVYELLDWRPAPVPAGEIVERCWMQMANETARAIADGVIEDPDAVDVGVVFGLGFPPFRGGILREIDRLGAAHLVERLETYAARYGERFQPAPLLVEMAAAGETFHRSDRHDRVGSGEGADR